MKKFNKFKVSTMLFFIVLMLSTVFATGLTSVAGSGTSANPFIISPTAGARKITFKYGNSMPFYFTVTEPGLYEVDFNSTEETVSFVWVESPSSTTSVLHDEYTYKDIKNWQVGVAPRLVESALVSVPMYNIQEHLTYSSSINAPFGGTGSYYPNSLNLCKLTRKTTLRNASVESYITSSRGNLFFFTTQNHDDIENLFDPMGIEIAPPDPEADNPWWDYYVTPLGNMISISSETQYRKASVIYKFDGKINSALNIENNKGDTVETILTYVFDWIGDVFLLKQIKGVMGKELTIDGLIFNTYKETKLDLYNPNATGINKVLRNVVNNWYNIFSVITYTLYIIILIYIGIMILLSVGTSRQSKVQNYLVDWVVGLAILLFLPSYGIPLLFKLNDALVAYLSTGATHLESYYNSYDIEIIRAQRPDILGSDSSTISIEELTQLKEEVSEEIDEIKAEIDTTIVSIKDNAHEAIIDGLAKQPNGANIINIYYDSEYQKRVDEFLDKTYELYKRWRDFETNTSHENAAIKTSEEVELLLLEYFENEWFSDTMFTVVEQYLFGNINGESGAFDEVLNSYNGLYEKEKLLEAIERTINVKRNDLMGTMRAYAGKYHKLVFVVIWYILLFQFIALIFLYYKRIFVIAILIAIFPLIMLSYCIDKMADGSAQTFTLWFKELLANIFIQTIHAIIYTVLVEMGLTIYMNDTNSWFFLFAALLLIIPSESILKEVFELNGSTLRALGGSAMKTATAVGALVALSRAGKSRRDETLKKANEKRVANLQKRQNRADTKASIRAAKRARDGRTINGFGKFREGVYHGMTSVRKGVAKAMPYVDQGLRVARNVAATTAGALYGLSAGDAEGLAQGAQIATALSGKSKKVKKADWNLKTEISSAYKRKKKKP